jgi:hypothetical protein
MGKSHVGRYLALVVIVNAGIVWAQSNATLTSDGPLPEGIIAFFKETSTGCSTFARHEYRYSENINEQRPSINGVMVAEDMRCRQCRAHPGLWTLVGLVLHVSNAMWLLKISNHQTL